MAPKENRTGLGKGRATVVLYPFPNRLCKAEWRKAEWHGVSDASICQMQGISRVRSTDFHNATDFVCWPGAGVIKCLSKARILRTKLMTHSSSDKYQTDVALCFVKVNNKRSSMQFSEGKGRIKLITPVPFAPTAPKPTPLGSCSSLRCICLETPPRDPSCSPSELSESCATFSASQFFRNSRWVERWKPYYLALCCVLPMNAKTLFVRLRSNP